ncbi:MAG: alpha/beta hydrolase [Mucilaginibacter sp.]|uniref:alpha/beta fold hydrolase n=1 Tax=Mucilaginibacter sp. TaxID=1882438 RepID=UPI0031A7607C
MKKLKELFNQVKESASDQDITDLLWQLICYSPKFPLRLQQQQLLDEARPFTLDVEDPHFSHSVLKFNGFIWGEGKRKVMITHGWGSKAADFSDMISALRSIDDTQVIAFDAPGNGSSEGELSNLLLFTKAAEAVMNTYGVPDVLIGHSLGAMANVMALKQTESKPLLQISIAPLIRLKENFIATMTSAEASQAAQDTFFENFESLFELQASMFNLNGLYAADNNIEHWLAYDREDKIAPYTYLQEFLVSQPGIQTREYEGVGHERIIKDAELIEQVVGLVRL